MIDIDVTKPLRFAEHVLEKTPVMIQEIVTRRSLEMHVKPHVYWHDCLDRLVVQLQSYVYSEESAPKEVIEYPRDWWQWFKQRWAPGWFLSHYPVKKKRHVITHKIHYPGLLKFKCPEYSETIRFMYNRTEDQ